MRTGPLPRLLAWAGLIVAILFILLVGGTYPWMGAQTVRVLTHVAIGAVLVGWLAVAIVRPGWRPALATVLPVAIVLAVGMASAIASPVPRVALASLAQGGATALLFLFLCRLAGHAWFRPRLTMLLVILPTLMVVAYLGQVGEAWLRWWSLVGQLTGPPLRPDSAALTFGATPVVACLALLLGPFATVATWARSRPAATVLAAAALATVVISGSRAAYLGLACAAFAMLALVLVRYRQIVARSVRGLGKAWLVPVAAVALAAIVLGRPLAARLLDLTTIGERFDIWQSALTLFGERPLLGTGPGTWPLLKYAANPPGVPNLVVPHAHSTLVQSLAELGLVGVAALGFLIVVIAGQLLRAGRPDQPGALRGGAAAALVGLAGFVAMSLVDSFANLLAVVLPVMALVAWVVGGLEPWSPGGAETGRVGAAEGSPRGRGRLSRGTVASAVTLGLVLIGVPIVARIDDAALTAESGARAADRDDWSLAAATFRRAVALDPDEPVYWMQLGAALAATGDPAAARTEYARLVGLDGYAMNLLSLASLELELGDRGAALSHARLALARGIGDPLIALNAGAVAERAGDLDLALSSYATALATLPELGAADYWTSRALPAERIFDAARATLASAGSPPGSIAGELLRAWLGDPGGAAAALERLAPSAERERAIAVSLDLQGRFDEAIDRVSALLARQPLDGQSAALLAQLEAEAGDTEAAGRHADWARLIGVGTTAQSASGGSRIVTAREAGESGQPANYPWMIYLRFTSRTLTPPGYLVVTR